MPASELDVPIVMSADHIRRREFATVRRGYDPDQVRRYLEQVADTVASLESRLREARLRAEATHPGPATSRPDPYAELSARIADLIRAADQQAGKLRREAAEEAERILSEARADADRIRLDAQAKAEEARAAGDRALREARERADRAVAGLSAKRRSLVEQLQVMQERLLAVARELEDTIDRKAAEGTAGEPEGPEDRAPEGPRGSEVAAGEAFVDPRYEDLWTTTTSTETVDLTLPDMPPLDLGLDDEGEDDAEAHGAD